MSQPPDFQGHYNIASDDQLLLWADDVANLVPSARHALHAEMQRRGLSVEEIEWAKQPETPKLKVGGWLFLYCFSTVIADPIWLIITTAKQPSIGLFCAPYSLLLFWSGLLLWKKNPSGLRWVRRAFLLWAILLSLGFVVSVITRDALSTTYYAVDCILGSIPLFLWWRYFRKSKYINELYGENMRAYSTRNLTHPNQRKARFSLPEIKESLTAVLHFANRSGYRLPILQPCKLCRIQTIRNISLGGKVV